MAKDNTTISKERLRLLNEEQKAIKRVAELERSLYYAREDLKSLKYRINLIKRNSSEYYSKKEYDLDIQFRILNTFKSPVNKNESLILV